MKSVPTYMYFALLASAACLPVELQGITEFATITAINNTDTEFPLGRYVKVGTYATMHFTTFATLMPGTNIIENVPLSEPLIAQFLGQDTTLIINKGEDEVILSTDAQGELKIEKHETEENP